MTEEFDKYVKEVQQLIQSTLGIRPTEIITKEIITGMTAAAKKFNELSTAAYFNSRNMALDKIQDGVELE